MIFRTLRWRMVAAFGLVILITLLLSSALSLWATTTRFNILVTDEGRAQAQAIAPLLEASYALRGDWGGLDVLMASETLGASEWESDVDWIDIAADEMGMDEDQFYSEWDALGSLQAVAVANAIAPDVLVEAIVAAEWEAGETAVSNGELSFTALEEEMIWVETAVYEFIADDGEFEDGADWDKAIADVLGLSVWQFYEEWEDADIVELAEQRDIAPEQLIAAIMQAEQSFLDADGSYTDTEAVFYLADSLTLAREYVYESDWYEYETAVVSPDVFGLLTDNLFGDNRALIADANGAVVYDSEGALNGDVLDTETLDQGTILWNVAQTEPIGILIVAAGAGYYNAQQAAFLEGVAVSMVISGALAGLIALLAGWLVARHIAAPVTALTVASGRLTNGRLRERLPITSADELGQMSTAFNKMADELDGQQALRKRLVDDVSHELHTPLSVIQLELEAMRDGMQSPEQATAQTLQEIAYLRQLVDDLSLLTAEDGGMTLVKRPLDIGALTQQAVVRWQPQAQVAGIALNFASSPSLPLLQADETRLMQALGNLLSNGIRYGKKNGRLSVSCAVVEDEGGMWVETVVSDNGIGIPAAELPHIFDRFYRVDTARGQDGRGLGLAITAQIIELHGGTIWAESVMGEGSVFRYRLPLD